MNEVLLVGVLDVVLVGVLLVLVLWDCMCGCQNVKVIVLLGFMFNYLLSNNFKVRIIKDFSDKDCIVVLVVGVGFQLCMLQIEIVKVFGKEDFKCFDSISVSFLYLDVMVVLIVGGLEINVYFFSLFFQYQVLENKNVYKVISFYDIMGGLVIFNVFYMMQKFYDENFKIYCVFYKVLVEVVEFVCNNKVKVVDIFICVQKFKFLLVFVCKIVEDLEINFIVLFECIFVYVEQLYVLGVLKNCVSSWKDYFFEEVYV